MPKACQQSLQTPWVLSQNIPITGMEESDKAILRAAWTDLHKEDPALSIRLATYWVLRGGVGFSPKTGTALISNYVKENWSTKKDDNTNITYNDIYRMLEGITPSVFIDQFIRNNWNDNKLVPIIEGSKEDFHYEFLKGKLGKLTVTGKTFSSIKNLKWIKTSWNRASHLWKMTYLGEDIAIYTETKPLGDNGEYLEMSPYMIDSPMTNTTQTIEDQNTSEIASKSASEDVSSEKSKPIINKAKESREYTRMAEMVFDNYANFEKISGYTMDRAQMAVDEYRKGNKAYEASMIKALTRAGIKFDKNNLDKEVEKYC